MTQDQSEAQHLGMHFREARRAAGMSQTQLAKSARVSRLRIVRAEKGLYVLKLDEAVRIAETLKIPLERLVDGRWQPTLDLRGIALELFHLGIRDLEVTAPRVPGTFRPSEQIVTLALRGDRPEPRIVEATPSILARRELNVPLTLAFAEIYDPRVRHRLAWLSDITLTLTQLSSFPIEVKSESQLSAFVRAGVKPKEPDSLGHPRIGKVPPLWARWNVTYAGNLSDFTQRTIEAENAFQQSRSLGEGEE